MYEGVDTVVLHEVLAYSDCLPVLWQELKAPLDSYRLASLELSNVALLEACNSMEEHPVRDKHDELVPLATELARLDLKLNLVLQLLGALSRQPADQPALEVQFNALGAKWKPPGTPPAANSQGLLHIGLHSSLPQMLILPSLVSGSDGAWVGVQFSALSAPVAELLQRFCFLRHRRRVADARRTRG